MKNTTKSEIRFVRGEGKELVQRAALYLAGRLNRCLEAGERVLWLVPGGSAIKVATEASKLLKPPLTRLTATLTDERFGLVGHADSNWRQLSEAGFKLPGAKMLPVLRGLPLQETADKYARELEESFGNADYAIALAGMGADGHILGIKPGSPAINSKELAVGYEWEDFTRLSATPKAMVGLDEIVVYAVGQEKHPQLDKLSSSLPLAEHAAQALKLIPKVTIFNDYKGG